MQVTTEREYILNLETGKIELHFEKQEYQALPEATKKEIKSAFIFSGKRSAWVSRAKEPNLWRAHRIAAKLGFTQEQRTGERLSYAKQVERKAERAEARAERYEGYADNADKRREHLQADFNKHRGDIAFVTQPNINSNGGRAFTNYRNKVMNRYSKGFEEYRKSEYFKERATIAQNTANMKKYQDRVYLDNRIRECEKNLKQLTGNLVRYEEILHSLENATDDRPSIYTNNTIEGVQKSIEYVLERMETEIDKQAYMENCLDEIGGIQYSKANIKPGYIVQIRGSRDYQVIKANPKTVDALHIGTGMTLNYNYSEIQDIVKAEEVKPKNETEQHPYKEGEILVHYNCGGNRVIRAYQVIKRTAKTIQVQEVEIVDNIPQQGQFKSGSKPQRKKPSINNWSGNWAVYDDDWQLYKYTA